MRDGTRCPMCGTPRIDGCYLCNGARTHQCVSETDAAVRVLLRAGYDPRLVHVGDVRGSGGPRKGRSQGPCDTHPNRKGRKT